MNKFVKNLLIVTFTISSSLIGATNKTTLTSRSKGVNLATEYVGFNELINDKKGDFFGANFQIVPFYSKSSDSTSLGKYFGINNKNIVSVSEDGSKDFNPAYMIHDKGSTTGTGFIQFNPKMKSYGSRIDYHQDLEKVVKGLYLKASLPIVYIENKMHLNTNATTTTDVFTTDNLNAYFNGSYDVVAGNSNAQEALRYAKITGSNTQTSVADLDVILGYKVLDKPDYFLNLNLGVTIPTGNTPKGEYVFEAVVGNGGHWGLGAGFDSTIKLWENDNQNLKLTLAANYRYLFESTETRTLGLLDSRGNQINWGQYYLAIDTTTSANLNTLQLIPVANILTLDTEVDPGSQVDAVIYFTYNINNWNINLGYNFFWKEKEDVSLKNEWTNNVYAVVNKDLDMSASNTVTVSSDTSGYINTVPATDAYGINLDAARTPSIDTHKIFGNFGYIFKDLKYPVMLDLGGAYEFADNAGIENWQIFGKVGIKF